MEQPATSQDILHDIEFEIAQGMLSKESFGPALEAVRQFQNRLRAQTFKSIKMNDPYREVISRQFQTVDMLLAVCQEMALRIQALQAALDNLGRRAHFAEPEAQSIQICAIAEEIAAPTRKPATSPTPATTPPTGLRSQAALPTADEVLIAMRTETISVPLQTRVIRWPLIGGLLTRLRIFYQRPAMHYTALLSERQAPVNRILGDRILHLEALLQQQQQQIQALQAAAVSSTPAEDNQEAAPCTAGEHSAGS